MKSPATIWGISATMYGRSPVCQAYLGMLLNTRLSRNEMSNHAGVDSDHDDFDDVVFFFISQLLQPVMRN